MPRYLSAFTPCGLLELSGKPARAKLIYDDLIDSYGPGFSFPPGSHDEATVYAKAMALARCSVKTTCAGNQRRPTKVYEMLPLLEEDYGIIPGPKDNIPTRQAVLAAKKILVRGARFESVADGLRRLLGDDYITYRALEASEAFEYPTWPSAEANVKSNPTLPTTEAKLVRLVDPVGRIGVPYAVAYENVDPTSEPILLAPNDVIMVQPENTGLSEKLTVASVTYNVDTGARTFTTTYAHVHDAGAIVTTGDWPYQWSTQRFVFVVVTPTASADPEKRRKINEHMSHVARGVTQWAIVTYASANTIGPFQLDVSGLGTATIGALSYVP